MIKKVFLTVIVFILLLTGCTSTTKSVIRTDIKGANKIALFLVNSSGIQSLSSTSVSGISSANMMNGQSQTLQAFEMMEFELIGIGLNIVNSVQQADAIVEFSIGQVRYDPLAGWIADRAILRFLDRGGNIMAIFKAETSFVTPTLNNLVKSLANEVSRNY